jgi:outer membrane protein OmpA-like peptidoglycan-associated protein
VVAALVRSRGADQAGLRPLGVSFPAPLAANSTDEGRVQNRRVGLVQY